LRKTGEASSSKPAVTDYIVGQPLEEALAGPDANDIVVSWPFLEGEVTDFVQAEALWYVHLPTLFLWFFNANPIGNTFCSPTYNANGQ
jgi:hypothetical protein